MEQVISVEPRPTSGKGAARKLRKAGKVPGILYGHQQKPQPFALEPSNLERTMATSGAGRNTVFRVQGLERNVLALVKDIQLDPIKHRLIHLDFVEVREDEEVVVNVAVKLTGKPAGVVDGGILQAVRRELRVFCKPLAIPHQIEVDTTHLHIGDSIHIKDVQFPAGTRPADGGHFTVATCVAPMAEEKVEDTAAAAAAAAAVPGAEGAPAAAAPAEGAPAKAEKEEKKGKG
jgi:large subunit ribosomal protein L25